MFDDFITLENKAGLFVQLNKLIVQNPAVTVSDIDGDGIMDYLDLDSDGRPDIVAPVNNAWEVKEREGGAEMEVWFNLGAR